MKCLFACFILLACLAPARARIFADLKTNYGTIRIHLRYGDSPKTVANFINLAEGKTPWLDPASGRLLQEPYYNGRQIQELRRNFLMRTARLAEAPLQGPGYVIADEVDNGLSHGSFVVSMDNIGPNSSGADFFITTSQPRFLDGLHSIFGEINDPVSRQVVLNINAAAVDASYRPLTPVVIQSVEIIRENATDEAFDTLAQGLPLFSQPANPVLSPIGDEVEITALQSANSVLQLSQSSDLVNWTPDGRLPQLAPADQALNLKRSYPLAGSQGFFRLLETRYADEGVAPASLSRTILTFTARNPQGTTKCYYDFIFGSGTTGSWQARDLSQQILGSGLITASELHADPYGGTLTIDSDNLPRGQRWILRYHAKQETSTGWTGSVRAHQADAQNQILNTDSQTALTITRR